MIKKIRTTIFYIPIILSKNSCSLLLDFLERNTVKKPMVFWYLEESTFNAIDILSCNSVRFLIFEQIFYKIFYDNEIATTIRLL